MKKLLPSLLFLGALTLVVPARAMSCSIVSTSGLAFGAYDVFSATPLESAGLIRYRCDSVDVSDALIIHLSSGNSSSFFPRILVHGGYQLDYNLYTSASRTTIWGDGSSGTGYYGPVTPQDGVEATVSLYGRIPAAQNAHVGSYSDTIIATVIF